MGKLSDTSIDGNLTISGLLSLQDPTGGGIIVNENLTNGNYSTEEIDTNNIWIDGSKIYKRTYIFNKLSTANNKAYCNHNVDISKIIEIHAIALTDGAVIQIPYTWNSDSSYIVGLQLTPNNIEIYSNKDRSNYKAYVTLKYTK